VEGADLPWRRTRDRYRILVAEVMLQATPVERVIPYYERWISTWSTPADLAAARLGDVLAVWQGLGYPRRARNLHRAAAMIAESGWPEPERFSDLHGVGPYTAAALRCFADGDAVLPVDTNIERILARRFPGGWPGTPDGEGWAVGQALMDLGRLYCTARAARCEGGCPLRDDCPAADAGLVDDLTPKRRPQGRYEGSLRQRRGELLKALADGQHPPHSTDPDAAESLVHDGLARRVGDALHPIR